MSQEETMNKEKVGKEVRVSYAEGKHAMRKRGGRGGDMFVTPAW